MPIITLLSDWGNSDHYVASVKGTILSQIEGAVIIDISHNIRHHNIKHASFVMRNAWKNFPEGTIHIIGVDSIESNRHPHVVVKAEGHYFICADTGLLSLILDEKPEKIIGLEIPQDSKYYTFPARDRFVKAAAWIAQGNKIEDLGEPLTELNKKSLLQPNFDGAIIHGKVMHVDHYENVFVNITESMVRELVGSSPYYILIRKNLIPQMVKAYGDVREGDLCALFASNGLLQIAINRGKASSLLGLDIDSDVKVVLGNP